MLEPSGTRKAHRTREIPRSEWRPFLERFSREHRAWLATVERVSNDGLQVEAMERPLNCVSAGEGIEIRFEDDTDQVEVVEPAALRIEETDEGAVCALRIDDESGERVKLSFRVTALPEALDGVWPGKL
ncbi:MAG: DUF5335 family protein [Betaproteobacteria bacterium]